MSARKPPAPKTPRGIEARLRRDGDGWLWRFRIRWTDPASGKRRVEELDTLDQARDFLAQLQLIRRRGMLAELDRGAEPLNEFIQEWWTAYAKPNLAASTRKSYAALWNKHGRPRIGHLDLRDVTPSVIARLRQELEADGVGAESIRKLMMVLQAVFREAVVWDRMPVNAGNPVQPVRKPTVRRKLAIVAFAPVQVEALRLAIPEHDETSAALISVLAYIGLRPEEALALEERHIRGRTLLVEQKNIDGEIVPGQKTNKPPRSPDLFKPVRDDLQRFMKQRAASADSQGRLLLFPRPDGEAWKETDYRNWRTRVFQPAAAQAGLASLSRTTIKAKVGGQTRRRVRSSYKGPRPYDLRHTAASLLLRDPNYALTEAAAFLGHDVATLSTHYAHVIAELKGQPPMPVERAILAARRKGSR